jgi:hypothetical protein
MSLTYAIITGFLAAVAHVLSGPDHLAAVAPFAVRSSGRSWRIGLFWGLGHLSGMFMIGILFTLLQDFPPLELISSYSEALVGFVLLGIGVWALYRAYFPRASHVHLADHHHEHRKKAHIATFSIGSLHGLAGVAHFILFIPVLGFENRPQAMSYILGFAAGTVVAMIAFTYLLGHIKRLAGNKRGDNFMKTLRLVSGMAAIGVGIYWITIL